MKIVVIGGTGLIGSRTVARLQALGHDVLAASPSSGVNTLTGEGLAEALAGAEVVVDLANAPSFDDAPVMEFFRTAGRNLLAAEAEAGVKHHVALSVVGTHRLQASGYFRAKLVQEQLIQASPIPYTIIRATQFFEFIGTIAAGSQQQDGRIRLSPALIRPIAADDVAGAMSEAALAGPANGIIDIAGPTAFKMDELVALYLARSGKPATIVTDLDAGYFGTPLEDDTLVPTGPARFGKTTLETWLQQARQAA